jgi:conjugative relaxase-like TrwC/TraI family protein
VGGDEAVRQAHRDSVEVALNEMEKFVQARMGGNRPAETTGKWIATSVEHESARPVNGYAAPQLHTHVVLFNLTDAKDREARALQPHQLYRSQQFATTIYRSELALRLKGSGYEIEKGKSGQPEIAGYTREYLDASSPRSQQIQAYLEQQGLRGAGAAQIAAHQTRDGKLGTISHAEMLSSAFSASSSLMECLVSLERYSSARGSIRLSISSKSTPLTECRPNPETRQQTQPYLLQAGCRHRGPDLALWLV